MKYFNHSNLLATPLQKYGFGLLENNNYTEFVGLHILMTHSPQLLLDVGEKLSCVTNQRGMTRGSTLTTKLDINKPFFQYKASEYRKLRRNTSLEWFVYQCV